MTKYVKEETLVKYNKAIELLGLGYNAKTASDEAGVKMKSLLRHMRVNGIPYTKPVTNIHPKHHQSIKDEYLSGVNSNILGNKYGCSSDTILRFLRFSGIDIVKPTEYKFYKEGYTINRDAFKDLGTEESAYFYGWLLTDGNIGDTGRVSLQVKRTDEDIVLSFNKYLGLSREVLRRSRFDDRTGNTYHSTELYFSDKVITERLQLLGMSPRKSTKEVCPDVFKNNRHFWRGVLEGDGWITNHGDSYGCGVVGSKELVESFQEYCKLLGVDKFYTRCQSGDLYECTLGSRHAATILLTELYKETSLFLERKYNIFKERYELYS